MEHESADVKGKNKGNIGIAFLGHYGSRPLSAAQVNASKALIRALNSAYGVGYRAGGKPYVYTHHDLAPLHRPDELVGATEQIDGIKKWSVETLPRPQPTRR